MFKTFATAALAVAATGIAHATTTVLFEDFEDSTVTYTTNVPEFTDGFGDFFIRTDGSAIGTFVEYSGVQGSSFFAVMDIDGDQSVEPVVQTFSGLDITGLTSLELSILVAEDDSSDGNEDWDAPDFVHIDYSIDAGPVQSLLWFENDGSTFNTEAFVDSNFDGTGDGAALTDTFTEFTAAIAGTGSTLDLVITYQIDSGDEDIAIDNVTITGVPEPASLALLAAGLGVVGLRRRSA
ncbi:MAG: PEP-CTERM sorting domain-containing protein [Planctomycetota bacterium]